MTDHTAAPLPVTVADPCETIALAAELAAYARAAGDALAMLEAARALAPLPRAAFAPGAATPAMYFGEARILAEGDAPLLAEIDAIQHGRPRPASRAAGSGYAAPIWIVRHRGTGARLTPLATALPPLRNRSPVWGTARPAPFTV